MCHVLIIGHKTDIMRFEINLSRVTYLIVTILYNTYHICLRKLKARVLYFMVVKFMYISLGQLKPVSLQCSLYNDIEIFIFKV